MVSSTFLKGQSGSLAFSFLIDANGTTRKLSMRHNTFGSITKEKLQQFTYNTKWTAAKHIRINDQYRLCFVWEEAGPKDVEIVDYH